MLLNGWSKEVRFDKLCLGVPRIQGIHPGHRFRCVALLRAKHMGTGSFQVVVQRSQEH